MDPASRAPEPRDRALSAEPCSTRLNPFDDGGDSSRKRRRTSLSGSRSLSVETVQSPSDDPTVSSARADSLLQPPVAMDTDPSTPQTPQTPQTLDSNQPTDPACPGEPASSRVTINLRNVNPSSPTSPTPRSLDDFTLTDGAGGPDNEVKLSVENPECEMQSPELPNGQEQDPVSPMPASPTSALSDCGSPDVEVIDVPDNDDDDDDDDVIIGDDEPEVTIISGARRVVQDPTLEFPYNDGEPLMETVSRLAHYITNQPQPEEALFESLQVWMDQFIRWADTAGHHLAYHSCFENLGFWLALPDLVWAACNRGLGRTAARQPITAFYLTFAKLTAMFVLLDCQTLTDAVSDADELGSGRIPETFSSGYLAGLHSLTRRDEPRILNSRDVDGTWLRPDGISELVQRFQTMPGGSLQSLTRLVEVQIKLMAKFPRLVDLPAAACQMASDIIWETERRQHFPGQPQQVIEILEQRLALGHRFFVLVTSALSQAIDKFVNHLSTDGVSGQILSLTDIYQCALRGSHEMAADVLSDHRQKHPDLPASLAPGAIAWEWRFDMFEKLIMSSQMQLRVWAVGHMCTDLVLFWRRFGEAQDEHSIFLAYFAEYLKRTELVEYILGPTCHPEITLESGNVVGFLLVTKFYQQEHTDLLWQTITSSQDRRVTDALTRMTANITHLYDYDQLLYLCEKLQTLPVELFSTASIRHLCEQVLKNLTTKCSGDRMLLSYLPYELCLRLLRQSSIYSAQSQVAYPEIQTFATQKLRELHHHGPDREGRRRLYLNCIEDISERSSTTLGSLSGLLISIRHAIPTELKVLTTEHSFARLLVDELDHAISVSRSTSGLLVLAGASNVPRRDFIYNLIYHEPDSLTDALGRRLWDMMVGPAALSQDDRTAGWHVLNDAARQTGFENSFVSTCLSDHFPSLPSDCFSVGALRFLKEGVVLRANDNDIALDNQDQVRQSGIEELWRMILTSSDSDVAESAIDVLVKDVYIDSGAIMGYPHHRARQVHLGLVNRCLEQLGDAARVIMSPGEDAVGGDEPMEMDAKEPQASEQELVFTRSLAALQRFLQAHQAKPHFAAADLRPLMPASPTTVVGESAELKYQSFDGDAQTVVRPLTIGRKNTAASLLASLKEATGFENYRIYFKGQAFVPNETEITRSLEELCIHDGLVLVKREMDGSLPSARMRPGASPLEIEILSHFAELWGYLSMEEKFAQEIYQFLVKLPADTHILERLDSSSTSYLEVFPLGQPFKCLYAIHALGEYTNTIQQQHGASEAEEGASTDAYKAAMERAMALIIAAIGDPEVIGQCPAGHLKSQLSLQLMNSLVAHLVAWRTSLTGQSTDWSGKALPLPRLLDILKDTAAAAEDDFSTRLICATYTVIWLLCVVNPGFWEEIEESDALGSVTQDLLLDPRQELRQRIAAIITETCGKEQHLNKRVAEFFWPYISSMLPKLVHHRSSCIQGIELLRFLVLNLVPKLSPVLDLPRLARQCADLLLGMNSTEDVGDLDPNDYVIGGLITLLHCCINLDSSIADPASSVFRSGIAKELFSRYLFPAIQGPHEPTPTALLNRHGRERLYQVIFELVKEDEEQFRSLLEDLKNLVPFDRDDDDPYDYELPMIFERSKAIRSSCGYAGMRNLSNTCYLNSLFTQLFMNVDFRRFILGANIKDTFDQKLLFQTQKLFSFMQESIRRFVDPVLVAGTIKTYDDTPIDVHNQMDVDEFYSLLFDRWEAQLLSADERKTLRSFYGGQLVQQVKSNECEHVSERLEPFSAIQCDIKGKGTLQDSLQAYVGGEIMEGDNKYKCSTCDKHVDAVKRACLKDIPDNLIFHLKRFDFNLRTMQRSKINDYFSFPVKIDMRPYTIEHLTNPDEAGPEDIFELVGVLVHSGTAESGHYYSYIRERPCRGAKERWVEFNDDLVSPWDPETMENSTFGGPDFRYDSGGVVYDKNYSAYMLFYQRSSSLQPVAEDVTVPVKVPLPEGILEHIRSENSNILRRHCLFDPGHAIFVRKVFEHCMGQIDKSCMSDHKMERLAMHMALGHLDQVVSRTKDVPDFIDYHDMLSRAISRCAGCALCFFKYFRDRPDAFRALVQRNPEPVIRSDSGDLLIAALSKIKTDLPLRYGTAEMALEDVEAEGWAYTSDAVVVQVYPIFDALWGSFHTNLRSWNEVFTTILRFAQLGDLETAALLNNDLLHGLLKIIQADASLDMEPNYQRMVANIIRRGHNRLPSYDAIITLVNHLLGMLHHDINSDTIVEGPESRLFVYLSGQTALPWTSQEVTTIHQDWQTTPATSIFVCKLLEINQAPMATARIIQRLISAAEQMDTKVFCTLRVNILGQMMQSHYNAPYLRAAAVYCRTSDDEEHILRMLVHVASQCLQLNSTEGPAFLDFFTRVYVAPEAGATVTKWSIFFTMTSQIAKWAPHLLAYYDREVRVGTEDFLQKHIFGHGTAPAFGEEDGGERRKEVLVSAARELGFNCLLYLRDNFIQRRVQVAKDVVLPLQRVIAKASAYFNLEPEEMGPDQEFAQLSNNVLEAIKRITVDVLEDDGSDWDNSAGSSADLETFDTPGDADLQ